MRHREYETKKFCAPRCTVSCVQQVAMLDNWRDPQTLKPNLRKPGTTRLAPAVPEQLVQIGSTRADS
jgi:hypothetical protein